jgi:Ca-activated chloride channel family protein
MRSLRALLIALLPFTVAALTAFPALADGIIIPDPPICRDGPCPLPPPIQQLAIRYHRVHVTIENQVATTRVDQVFRNDNDWTVEGTYIFPLPTDAAVTNFTLWIDGEPVQGKVLTREEARRQYEEIVRNLRDPALLEYVDRGAVQASIFPIAPGAERRIELEYTQVLQADAGLIHYSYPLNTEKFSSAPLEDVSVTVDVTSTQPVAAIYSPSHEVVIDRQGSTRFTVSYEDSDVTPDRDFELYYSVPQEDIGLSLLTYRNPDSGDPDGYFLLLAAPGLRTDDRPVISKDVVFVLDQSGSMEGEKFRQAKTALAYALDHLNSGDRFNVIAFSSGTRAFASGLRPADEASEAVRWLEGLSARGSTDIDRALLEAVGMMNGDGSEMVIFLTDGLPTEGVTESRDILKDIERSAPKGLRLFAFGVGYDVDTYLLDSLAQDHHGTTSYVTPGQSIDEIVSGFYNKVSQPVLMDLELDLGEATTFDIFPDPLPDIFAGGQLVAVGRYRDPGSEVIELSGLVNGQVKRFTYEDQRFRSSGGPDFLPRLWATRKIGYLLNQIRLEGPEQEIVDQIVKLSIRYGIVTPYTSYLVTEPQMLGADAQKNIAQEAYDQFMAMPTEVSGQSAVERAAAESAMGGADIPLAPPAASADVVRLAGPNTFRLVDDVWTDTRFDPETMVTVRVPFLSADYFALADAIPEVGQALSLGPRVIIIAGATAYEIVGEDEPGDAIQIPTAPAVEPGTDTPTIDPPAAVPPSASGGPGMACPGLGVALGLTAFPLARRRRR